MEFVVIVFLMGIGIAVTAKVLGRLDRPSSDRVIEIEGINITIRSGVELGMGEGTVLRTGPIAVPRFQMLVAHDHSRFFSNIEPRDRVDLSDPEFEGMLRVWSNDLALAKWWIASSTVRDRLYHTGAGWGFRIDEGFVEAHTIRTDANSLTVGLSATAGLASRGDALEPELRAARQVLVENALSASLELVREEHGALFTRIETRTRFRVARTGQEPFSLQRHLAGETKRMYDEVAPALVEADDFQLHLDLAGIVTEPDAIIRAAQLAARLAEPPVTPVDDGPYR